VDRDKGRFRSFLLACLNHFLAKEWRDRNTLKRGAGQIFVPIDMPTAEAGYAVDQAQNHSPEQLYDQRWALGVMERAMQRLRQEFATSGKEGLFDELKGFLSAATEDGEYDLAAARLNMTRIAVATAVHRLRRNYRERVREEVAQTVTTPLELEEEMRYLLKVLTR
jgi:RNA polymerase sigma-70 factor (ECF subfamily)